MTPAPRKVATPAIAHQGESLIGLVRSCAWDNRLPSISVLLREATSASHAWGNLATRSDLDTARLATALRVAETDVLARMYPETCIHTNFAVRSFFGVEVRAQDLKLDDRSFSPGALEHSGHHRAIWQHGLLPFCLETGELLINRCGSCGRRLEWGAAKPLTRCSHCNRPAATKSPAVVDSSALEAGRRLFGLIDPALDPQSTSDRSIHPELSVLSPGAAFDLCWSIGRLISGQPIARRSLDRLLKTEGKLAVIRAADEVLTTWPEGISARFKSLVRRNLSEAQRLQRGIRSLRHPRARWPGHLELLIGRYAELFGRTRAALRTVHGSALDGQASLPLLKMSASLVPKLVEAGAINTIEARAGRKLHAVMDACSVADLAALRDDRIALGAVSERLGISRDGVNQLLAANLLDEHQDPAIAIMFKDRQISLASFNSLVRDIRRSANGCVGNAYVTLSRAACQIGGRHKPWAALVEALINGSLPFAISKEKVRARGRPPLMDAIMVQPYEGTLAETLLIAACDTSGPFRSTSMSRRDACEVLNLTPRQLQTALAQELSAAALPGGTLAVSEVLRVAQERISPAEIAMRFSGGKRSLPAPLRDGRLVRLGASGWDRVATEVMLLA